MGPGVTQKPDPVFLGSIHSLDREIDTTIDLKYYIR